MQAVDGALLNGLYDAPADPRMWRQTLDEVCQRFDVRSAAIQVLRRHHTRLEQEWCVRDSYSDAHRTAHDRFVNNAANPRLNLELVRRPTAGVARDASIFSPGCPQLRQLRNNLAQVGLGTYLGAAAELADDITVSIVLHRRLEDDRDYTPEHEHLLLDLLPHVRRAVGLALEVERLKAHGAALERTLDQLQTGVLLCSGSGQVRWANDAAKTLLSRSPRLRLAEARLRCARRGDASAITAMFMGRAPSEAVQLGGAEDEDNLHLLSKRLAPYEPAGPGGSEPMTAVFVTGAPKAGILSPEILGKLFGLTPAEARLTMALCDGRSVNDHALQRSVAVGTVRIQMKRVLAKTGCHRQADLVRRVLTSVAAQAQLPGPEACISHLGVVPTVDGP